MRFVCIALLTLLLATVADARPCPGETPDANIAAPVAAPAMAAMMTRPSAARLQPALLLQPARQTLRAMVAGLYTATAARSTTLSPATSRRESLDALPVIGTVIGTVQRRAGRRFNTEDASIDDFAICYRLSSRVGLQMIPGDPAPVKLAVTSMANNAGVTLGMTWRLSRR